MYNIRLVTIQTTFVFWIAILDVIDVFHIPHVINTTWPLSITFSDKVILYHTLLPWLQFSYGDTQ